MATITITTCPSGCHMHMAITTSLGPVLRTVDIAQFLEQPDAEELADIIIYNARIRATKAGATDSAGVIAATNTAVFQEPI